MDNKAKFQRILKNGMVIRGQFATVGQQAARFELFISMAAQPNLWNETTTNFNCLDPQAELLDVLDLLEAQVKDCCIDQVPVTAKGLILIRALLEELGKMRRNKRKAA